MVEQDGISEYPNHTTYNTPLLLSQGNAYHVTGSGNPKKILLFRYKIHPAVLILSAVLTKSINMDMSVQTKG
jgi:hypothetical protein